MNNYAKEMLKRGSKSAEWLASRVNADGSLHGAEDDLGCYYKCVYPLRTSGYTHLASKMCDKIMELHYTSKGDLWNSTGEKKTKGTYTSKYCQVYPNAWIALGAYLIGRYDIVRKLVKGINDLYYDEEMGTIRTCVNPVEDLYDANSAAMAIEVYSITDMPKAIRAADFLKRLLEIQPDPENWFYSRVDKKMNISTDLTSSPMHAAIQKNAPRQAYWFLGMPSAAFLRLYGKTGYPEYLRLGIEYFDYCISCGENVYEAAGSGKTMWSAAILYRLTKDKKYLNACLKIMEFFFSMQKEDGSFVPLWMSEADLVPKFMYDIIPEYTRWFFDVPAELCTAD